MGGFAFSHPLSPLLLSLLPLSTPFLTPLVSKTVHPPIAIIRLLSLTLNPDTCLVMFSSSEKLRWISALAPPRGELDLLECPGETALLLQQWGWAASEELESQ